MARKKSAVTWLPSPEAHDYPAAQSYLSLLYTPTVARGYVDRLRRAAITEFAAKDIFRASGLSLLGISNSHIVKDRRKILSGAALSPLLLVRDTAHGKVIVADGYHRMCAAYAYDEDLIVPCKIV